MENEILNQILSKLQNIEDEVRGVKDEVREVKERVIIMENEHGQSLKSLHDGYKLLYGISEEIREDVRRLYSHQDKQDARTMLLDGEISKNSNAV